MSLRVKSLIAAFLLVVGVTTALSVINEDLFAQSVGEIIEDELKVSSNTLMRSAEMSELKAATALSLMVRDGTFVDQTVRRRNKDNTYRVIGDDFKTFLKVWLANTGFDVAVSFYDTFVAEDRKLKPTNYATYDELTACAFHNVEALDGKTKKSKNFHSRILQDELFKKFVNNNYADFVDSIGKKFVSEVVVVDHSAYLVVATPLLEKLQGDDGLVGMALVMKELSADWAHEQLLAVNDNSSENKLQLIVYGGGRALSYSFDDHNKAMGLLSAANARPLNLQKFSLATGSSRFISIRRPFSSKDGPGLMVFKNFDKELDFVLAHVRNKVIWGGVLLALAGIVGAYFMANTAVTRVNRLAEIAHKVRDGDFSQTVQLKGNDEITRLGEAFNDMNKGLNALGLYTDPALALGVVQGDLNIDVDQVEGSIYFSDIADFTTISEQLGSKQLVEQLNEYFTAMGEAIKKTGGYLDKFIGDSIMAFWGKPLYKGADFALKSCEAALACKDMEDKLEVRWKSENKVMFYQRIGIATGECIVGNIGSKDKKNFTVIGDYVNLASRLEGANKFYGTRILLDAATAAKVKDHFLLREVDQIYLKGKSVSMRVFELLAKKTEQKTEEALLVEEYSLALSCYRKRDFRGANEILARVIGENPSDGPSQWLKSVCDQLELNPPEQGWEAVTLATGK